MLIVLKETHRAEGHLARNAEEKLLGIVFVALVTVVSNCLCDKLLDWAATDKISPSDLSSALWTSSVILHCLMKVVQAVQALNGVALWTHPDFICDQVEAHYALSKAVR